MTNRHLEFVDIADVYFYVADEIHEVSLTTLSPATRTARVDVTDGDHGVDISVDDGFFEMIITPVAAGIAST